MLTVIVVFYGFIEWHTQFNFKMSIWFCYGKYIRMEQEQDQGEWGEYYGINSVERYWKFISGQTLKRKRKGKQNKTKDLRMYFEGLTHDNNEGLEENWK